jgi:hypothetical protein
MKKKESVVVFDGEEKFIKPRSMTYDLKAGKSEFVGIIDEVKEINPARENPYGYNQGTFQMPDKSDPLFCARIKEYINTRGAGTATPESIMSAYNAFNQFCKESASPDSTTTETTTSTTTETTTTLQSGGADIKDVAPPNLVSNSPISFGLLNSPPLSEKIKKESDIRSNKNVWLVLMAVGVIGAAYFYYKTKKK